MTYFKLDARREANLRYLASFLGALPDDYMNFDMGTYAIAKDESEEFEPHEMKQRGHTCGTSVCALGHLPLLGFMAHNYESWEPIGGRVLGLAYGTNDLGHDTAKEWDWCFDGGWQHLDNTPKGAAQRILWMLDHTPEEVREAFKEADKITDHIRDGSTRHQTRHRKAKGKAWCEAKYGDIVIPPISDLNLDRLPKRAGMFSAMQAANEPIMVEIAA